MSLRDIPKHENRTSDNVEQSLKPKNFVLFSEQIPRYARSKISTKSGLYSSWLYGCDPDVVAIEEHPPIRLQNGKSSAEFAVQTRRLVPLSAFLPKSRGRGNQVRAWSFYI